MMSCRMGDCDSSSILDALRFVVLEAASNTVTHRWDSHTRSIFNIWNSSVLSPSRVPDNIASFWLDRLIVEW